VHTAWPRAARPGRRAGEGVGPSREPATSALGRAELAATRRGEPGWSEVEGKEGEGGRARARPLRRRWLLFAEQGRMSGGLRAGSEGGSRGSGRRRWRGKSSGDGLVVDA
jgi:hypothetical protein